jgi:hypothetical protein
MAACEMGLCPEVASTVTQVAAAAQLLVSEMAAEAAGLPAPRLLAGQTAAEYLWP